jgi:hypothetical protein
VRWLLATLLLGSLLLGSGCDRLFGLRDIHQHVDAPLVDGRRDGPIGPTDDSESPDVLVPPGTCDTVGLVCSSTPTLMVINGGCYVTCHDLISWTAARARCQAWGGDLAVLDTPQEDLAVTDTLNSGHWIGMQQMQNATQPQDGWVWITGTSVNNERWYPGEGMDGSDQAENHQEDCGWAIASGWGDFSCTVTAYVLCER